MRLVIEKVNKNYGELQVLKNVSLSLDGVSAIGIIGESGCGKSTLLRQLACIEQPNSGDISVNGLSLPESKWELQEQLGYVFQKHNLFPHLTVAQNILLILEKMKKLDKQTAERRLGEVLKTLRIESEAHKKPNEISGGQAQRASIARALATHPRLIFLDEPTAALDPLLTDEVLKSVQELKNSGIEFIFVTHEIDFLKEFADYVIFMKDGEIAEHGDITCLASPKTQELRSFLRL